VNRRLMIAASILVLALMTLALIAMETPLRADGATVDRPVLQNAMSGDFAQRTLACAGVRRAPSIFVPSGGRGALRPS
jgi:hypothetical protein